MGKRKERKSLRVTQKSGKFVENSREKRDENCLKWVKLINTKRIDAKNIDKGCWKLDEEGRFFLWVVTGMFFFFSFCKEESSLLWHTQVE